MDYSARSIQILSYTTGDTDPVEIQRALIPLSPGADEVFTVGGSALADGPAIITTSISLHYSSDIADGFLETDFNPRWAKGNKLEIYARNSAGTFVLSRTLRILDNAVWDWVEKRLPLSLGCLFALKDSRYPPPGNADITKLAPLIVSQTPDVEIWRTVNYWLTHPTVGVGKPITFLSGDYVPPERIVTTEIYKGGESVVSFINKILYFNSRCILWIDAQERVRVRKVKIAETLETRYFDIGDRILSYQAYLNSPTTTMPAADIDFTFEQRDLVPYAPVNGEREKVAGSVKVTGTSNFRYVYQDPPPQGTSSFTNGVQTSESVSIYTNPNGLSRTNTKNGTTIIAGQSDGTTDAGLIGDYTETSFESYGGGAPAIYTDDQALPFIPALPNYLKYSSTVTQEQRLATDGKSLLPLATTKRVDTDYIYRLTQAIVQGQIMRGVEIKQVDEVTKILPAGETTLKVSQVKKESWQYLGPGKYAYNLSISLPRDVDNRRNSKQSSSSGVSTPPATNFAPPLVLENAVEMLGVAKFSYPPGAPDNDHPREYNCGGYLDNNFAANLLAWQYGTILIGRNRAITVGFPVPDSYLASPKPLPLLAVTLADGEQDIYLLDSPQMIFGRRFYLGAIGIWVGRRNPTTGTLTYPWALTEEAVTAENGAVYTNENNEVFVF